MALGDAIFIQLNQALVGYGNKGDVLAVTETATIEALMAAGFVTVTATPGPSLPLAAGGELAYAANSTGTVTFLPVTNVAQLITGCSVVIPACARPVWIEAGVEALLVANASGLVTLLIYETTTGTPVLWKTASNTINAAGTTSRLTSVRFRRRLGVTATLRTFALYASNVGDSGTLSSNVQNGGAYGESYIAAVAE